MKYLICAFLSVFLMLNLYEQDSWQSRWVSYENGELRYIPDEKGNTIPDFGRVGYHEGEDPSHVAGVIEVSPEKGDNYENIQHAIDEVSRRPLGTTGFRGAVLLKKGTYKISKSLLIQKSGVVLRGEGPDKTILIATAKRKYDLIIIKGSGQLVKDENSKVRIDQNYVPVGTKKLVLDSAGQYHKGDNIIVFRPGTQRWIHDLHMDQIHQDGDTRQWTPGAYNLSYERRIEQISGDTIFIDYPIVMSMEDKYGGGYVFRYRFDRRISECGVEDLQMQSVYASETDEEHAWTAVKINNAQHCWARNVEAKYFAYSCVTIGPWARNVTVMNCKSLEPKSVVTGGRRYAFNCDGQLNLFKGCYSTYGRHDYVTGAQVCGPNVFTQSEAVHSYTDIGPHHRWATGTLYDDIKTDGSICVQDRGDYGTGHGWAGANQVFWNCEAKTITAQNPWVSAKNYVIGGKGAKDPGRFPDRPDGVWEGLNKNNIKPASLYEAQKAEKESGSRTCPFVQAGFPMNIYENKPNTKGVNYANFYWQDGYGIFSVNSKQVPDVVRYIKNHKEHHQKKLYF